MRRRTWQIRMGARVLIVAEAHVRVRDDVRVPAGTTPEARWN